MPDYPIPNDLIRWDDMDMTMQHEGWREKPYKDTVGKQTIGYGFNIDDPSVRALIPQDVLSGKRELNEKEAQPIFGKLYFRARNDVKNLVGEDTYSRLPDDVKGVLTDMSYNMGRNKLSGFVNMLKAVQRQDWQKTAAEMKNSKWYRQVGDRSKRLYGIMQNVGRKVKG